MNQQSNLTIQDWKAAALIPKCDKVIQLNNLLFRTLAHIGADAIQKFPNQDDESIANFHNWINLHPIVKMYVLRMTELCFIGETIQAVADEMVVAGSIVDTMIMALENQNNG